MAVAAEVPVTEIARVLTPAPPGRMPQPKATRMTAATMSPTLRSKAHVSFFLARSVQQFYSPPGSDTVSIALSLTYENLFAVVDSGDDPRCSRSGPTSPQATQPQAAQGRGAAEAAIPKWTPTTSRPRLDAA